MVVVKEHITEAIAGLAAKLRRMPALQSRTQKVRGGSTSHP